MQISISKLQDANNPDNSLIRKFDDFYKDNKNIENEVYFYRKPRVDKVLYQAEVQRKENYFIEQKSKNVAGNNSQFCFSPAYVSNNIDDIKSENVIGTENNGKNYFDKVTESMPNFNKVSKKLFYYFAFNIHFFNSFFFLIFF